MAADKRTQLASFSIQDILRLSADSSAPVDPILNADETPRDRRNPGGEPGSRKKPTVVKNGHHHKASDGGAKRIRTIFTQEQLDKLEANFERQQYMIRSERAQLATTLNLQEAQVKVWFQNRRIKWRKQQHEATMVKIRAYQETSTIIARASE